jgi:2-hydroxy-3-oxopropionate reductase
MNIGFVGLGLMGRPMAGHLLKGGYKVFANDLFLIQNKKPLPEELAGAGAVEIKSLKELASQCDVIITMVPDTPDVEKALFGKDGIAEGLAKGKIVMDMSSISPIETQEFAKKVEALGCDYIDAPVSGGEVGAKAASLTIMCGAKQAVFDKVKPLLELMGKNITLVGDAGAGQITKVANQIIVALNIQAVGEALLFASKAGADPAKVRQALMGGFASSRILEVHGERMIKRTFDPGFRIMLHSKDLNLALSNARKMGISLPNTATAQEMFNSCIGHGDGGKDHSALVTALERLGNHKVA